MIVDARNINGDGYECDKCGIRDGARTETTDAASACRPEDDFSFSPVASAEKTR
jgi:hypothetical protein